MPRPRFDAALSPPGVVLQIFVIALALSFTSCPHQGDAVRLLVRAIRHQRSTAATRTVRRLVQDTASNAEHLTGPQITAPPYSGADPPGSRAPEPSDRLDGPNVDAERDVIQSRTSVADPIPTQPPSRVVEREPPRVVEPLIYAIGRETQVFAEPRFDARRVGYLRFGSDVRRTTSSVSQRSCAGGWFGVQPTGYVCANGRAATTDPQHPLVLARIERPDRMAPLPYAYTVAKHGIPRLYGFAPGNDERPKFSSKRLPSSFGHLPNSPMLDWWRRPHEVFGYPRPKDVATLGDGLIGGGVALLGFLSDAGTLYGVTPDLELVTTDALEPVRPSSFAGKAFERDEGLPVAFAMTTSSWLHGGDPRQGNLRPLRQLTKRESVNLSSERVKFQGEQWLSTKEGHWLRSTGMRIIEARTDWPEWALAGGVWVDVSIQQQSLVAYEGKRPAYATLVSTGVDGLLDPATTKSTKTGVFHIVSKHLTATMNGDAPDDAYEMREVPWVQYFSGSYALHGAYWHDGFGQPRSHGCINLSPLDARWLFHFTNPGVPKNWHGAIPSEPSATVFVHP